jgi:hypothetical protein
MRKRRQPNSAGFLAPASVKKTVEAAPVVAVEPAEEPKVEEPVVTESTPEVVEEVEVPEVVEPVTEPAVEEPTDTKDDTTDEVAF